MLEDHDGIIGVLVLVDVAADGVRIFSVLSGLIDNGGPLVDDLVSVNKTISDVNSEIPPPVVGLGEVLVDGEALRHGLRGRVRRFLSA